MDKYQKRKLFRDGVFERDNRKCKVCGKKEPTDSSFDSHLAAHHITDRNKMPNGGYVLSNGISLCSDCHWKAEEFHMCGLSADGYHPDDLYKIINSSYEEARKDSENLTPV